ncbi:MAG: SagB/ThcOx family dehydrogenase [Endomicrobia bacterium]|nr:SagB/ThcOx family dehydrogenase [Endomicrobiia bacterium]MDW8055810.1 SagB/ThcOx family dehydrogenase [Elusimicrobiota bacterium]
MRYKLPVPNYKGKISVEEVISKRRSIRKFRDFQPTDIQISQLLWSAYGVTDDKNMFKTVPSAGATYPLEIYYLDKTGIYHYFPEEHSVKRITEGDFRRELVNCALGQKFIAEAAISIVICAVYERTVMYYGSRGYRYVYMEAGHCAQNICLQAISLGLDSVCIGAFVDKDVKHLLKLPEDTEPIYIVSIGART